MKRVMQAALAARAGRGWMPWPPVVTPPSEPSALRTIPTPPTAPGTGDIDVIIPAGSSASYINSVIASASPGDVIALRGGTYQIGSNLSFEAVGTESNPVTVMGYPGETPILDMATAGSGTRIWMNGAQWMVVRDLELRNAKSHGFYLTGADGKPPACDNKFVNIVTRNSQLTGWAVVYGSRNKIWYSLAIWTAGVSTPGDADGFGPGGQLGYSEGNACYGCVAVDAPDDGFDTWQAYETELVACTSIRAGEYGGNGNGFKLGRGLPPEGSWTYSPSSGWYLASGTVRGCLSLDANANGFDSNTGADNELLHCTALNSGASGFYFPRAGGNPTPLPAGNIETNTLRNCLNLGATPDQGYMVQTTNSWQVASITSGDFVSVTAPATSAFAALDGEGAFDLIENGTVARLASDSDARGAGTELGYGTDLGAFSEGTASAVGGEASEGATLVNYPKVTAVTSGDWYVDASVGSSGDGTSLGTAFKTLAEGLAALTSGDTLLVKGGTYALSSQITRNTTWGSLTRIMAYGDDRPIIDAASITPNTSAIRFNGSANNELWHGFHVKNVPYNGGGGNYDGQSVVVAGASDITLSNMWVSHCRHDGIWCYGVQDVVVKDCRVWHLGDGVTQDTDVADTYAATGSSQRVHFVRCFSANAPDDAFDFWTCTDGSFLSCAAYQAGYYWNENPAGDGNGYKMGGGAGSGGNTVAGSVALGCRANGFDDNATPLGGNEFRRNTAYNNGASGFQAGDLESTTLRDNISLSNIADYTEYDPPGPDDAYNTWNLSITDASFVDFVNFDLSLDTGSDCLGVGESGGNLGADAEGLTVLIEAMDMDLTS